MTLFLKSSALLEIRHSTTKDRIHNVVAITSVDRGSHARCFSQLFPASFARECFAILLYTEVENMNITNKTIKDWRKVHKVYENHWCRVELASIWPEMKYEIITYSLIFVLYSFSGKKLHWFIYDVHRMFSIISTIVCSSGLICLPIQRW